MLTAWTAESVSGSFAAAGAGPFAGWSARDVHSQPRPVQRPHPPLWFHGNSAFGRARAARYGGGWLGLLTTPRLAATNETLAAFGEQVAGAVRDIASRPEEQRI